jgi:hypothetical protein
LSIRVWDVEKFANICVLFLYLATFTGVRYNFHFFFIQLEKSFAHVVLIAVEVRTQEMWCTGLVRILEVELTILVLAFFKDGAVVRRIEVKPLKLGLNVIELWVSMR